ncbi:hypothetical protein FRB94_000096 [Tulasnella sp. JGI-2019a]|nr:hypothetical protein FRB94_000096 [Tulasnella sp. JGI-2019a]KAG9015780.1 hypothetical protein FRB93_012345 [Tulasnella sp. JGI-2019a]
MHTLAPKPSASLPNFSRLFVKGRYPPTAPLHLCHSDIEASDGAGGALLLCCGTRQTYLNILTEYNDEWLNTHGGRGRIAHNLSQIRVMYPPTLVHLQLIISLLRPNIVQTSDIRIALDPPPSLIVLVDPSTLLGTESPPTISSFLLIVAETVACLNFLNSGKSSRSPRLAIFDRQFDELEFVVSPSPQPDDDEQADRASQSEDSQGDSAEPLIHQYFDWVGTVREIHTERPDEPIVQPDKFQTLELTLQPAGRGEAGATSLDPLVYLWELEIGEENALTRRSGLKATFTRQ